MTESTTVAAARKPPSTAPGSRPPRWVPDKTTVLVVGAGDLGEQTAKRLTGFGAVPVMVAHSARDGVHATDELPDLLPHADVVVLTVPLTHSDWMLKPNIPWGMPGVRHMLDACKSPAGRPSSGACSTPARRSRRSSS